MAEKRPDLQLSAPVPAPMVAVEPTESALMKKMLLSRHEGRLIASVAEGSVVEVVSVVRDS